MKLDAVVSCHRCHTAPIDVLVLFEGDQHLLCRGCLYEWLGLYKLTLFLGLRCEPGTIHLRRQMSKAVDSRRKLSN